MSVNATLKKLCSLPGVSGREDEVRAHILRVLAASPAEMEVSVDRLGSVVARLKGRQQAPHRVLFAAHMDEVGLVVTGITDLLIDLGCDSREEAEKIAAPGDVAVFDSGYEKLGGGLFSARALDDRAGCALLLSLAEETPAYDITLAFTVQEEVGLRGAGAVAFAVQPELAVVVDATTAADTAGVPAERQVCRQGKGAVLSFMDKRTLYDRPLYEYITALAEKENLPVQPKTVVAGGNDAGAIQLTGAGCRVAAISLPCRYIHSPACALRKEDLRDTLALLRLLRDRLPAAGV